MVQIGVCTEVYRLIVGLTDYKSMNGYRYDAS